MKGGKGGKVDRERLERRKETEGKGGKEERDRKERRKGGKEERRKGGKGGKEERERRKRSKGRSEEGKEVAIPFRGEGRGFRAPPPLLMRVHVA